MMQSKAVWGTNDAQGRGPDAAIARRRLAEVAEEAGLAFEELLALWTDDTEQHLAAANAALMSGNLVEAARLVHSASSASGLCGVRAIAEQLRIVERLAAQGRGAVARQALEQAQVRFACLTGALSSTS
jgi:HPt (histidine-containing phosphotransfer) domain-containing protein